MPKTNTRILRDDFGQFFPYSTTDYIIGGIGQGNYLDIKDYSNLINSAKYEGEFKIMKLDSNLMWITADINTKGDGYFNAGDNIITGSGVPMVLNMDTDFVFTHVTNGTSRSSFYLGTDGRLHLHIIPRKDYEEDPLGIVVYDTTEVTGLGLFLKDLSIT